MKQSIYQSNFANGIWVAFGIWVIPNFAKQILLRVPLAYCVRKLSNQLMGKNQSQTSHKKRACRKNMVTENIYRNN